MGFYVSLEVGVVVECFCKYEDEWCEMVLQYFRIWWMSVPVMIVTSWEVFSFMCVDTLWMSLDSDNCLPYQQSM